MARSASARTISDSEYAFKATQAGGSDGSPMRSVFIRCDSASTDGLDVTVEPTDEGAAVTLFPGESRTVACGDTRAITSIFVAPLSDATYTFWPTG